MLLPIFGAAALVWHVPLSHTRHGFAAYMIGSNAEAARYWGIGVKQTLVLA